jgi:hypothetical protein
VRSLGRETATAESVIDSTSFLVIVVTAALAGVIVTFASTWVTIPVVVV